MGERDEWEGRYLFVCDAMFHGADVEEPYGSAIHWSQSD